MIRSAIITGSTGFLGSKLKALLLNYGYRVITIDRSVVNPTPGCVALTGNLANLDLYSCVPREQYFACFHFAGSSSVQRSWEYPLEDFSSGIPCTLNLIQFLAKYHPNCQLVVSSSAAVYGNPSLLPIRESSPALPISPYGVHKFLNEELCFHYSNLYSIPIRVLRIFSAYGAGLQRQLLWDTTKKILNSIVTNQDYITLWGTGNETRDFIHSTDVARAALCVADSHFRSNYEVVNVASGVQISIAEVANYICHLWGGGIVPVFEGQSPTGDPTKWCADISKLSRLNFIAKISFDQGLQDYISWAKKILK
jgi:UDP-glucose 4-epimerase